MLLVCGAAIKKPFTPFGEQANEQHWRGLKSCRLSASRASVASRRRPSEQASSSALADREHAARRHALCFGDAGLSATHYVNSQKNKIKKTIKKLPTFIFLIF